MMGGNSAFVLNHHCIILIIDVDFIKRFDRIIVEMSAMIRNCTIYTPLFLVFEDEYDPCFVSWSQYAKRLFKLAMHDHHLHDAISKVIQ